MKRLLIIVVILITGAYAQTPIVGGTFGVSGTCSTVSGGGLPNYRARTDTCELGTEGLGAGQCVSGATVGQAGAPMSFLYRDNVTISATPPYYTVVNNPPCNSGTTLYPLATNCYDAPLFAQGATSNTDAYDPDFGTHIVLLTDSTSFHSSTMWNTGASGIADRINFNTSIAVADTDGAANVLFYINTANIRGSTACSALSKVDYAHSCVWPSQIKGQVSTCPSNVNCTNNIGYLTFSRTDPYIMFEFTAIQVNKLLICDINGISPYCHNVLCPGSPATCTPDTFIRSVYHDFGANGILGYNYVMSSHGNFKMGENDQVSVQYAGGPDWQASSYYLAATPSGQDLIVGTVHHAIFTPGTGDWTSFILPQLDTRNHGYYAVTSGYTAATETTAWSQTNADSSVGSLTRYICEGASTAYTTIQTNLSCGSTCGNGSQQCTQWVDVGVVANQDSGHDILNYTPGVGESGIDTYIGQVRRGQPLSGESCIASTLGGTCWPGEQPWTNNPVTAIHPPSPPAVATPTGWWTTDNPLLCGAYTGIAPSNGTTSSTPCPLGDTPFLLHSGHTIPNGAYATYSQSINSITANGSWMNAANSYYGNYNSSFTYNINNIVTYPNVITNPVGSTVGWSYYKVGGTGGTISNVPPLNGSGVLNSPWTLHGYLSGAHIWHVPELVQRSCTMQDCGGHDIEGTTSQWLGSLYSQSLLSAPSMYCTSVTSGLPCSGYTAGLVAMVPNPGTHIAPLGFPGDTHETPNGVDVGNAGMDAGVIDFLVDTVSFPYTGADSTNHAAGIGPIETYNQENVGAATGLGAGNSVAAGTNFRFGHSFNAASNISFGGQNGVCIASQDGQWMECPTDVMNTRGSRSLDWSASISASITSISGNSTKVTVLTSVALGVTQGDAITVSSTGTSYDGTWIIATGKFANHVGTYTFLSTLNLGTVTTGNVVTDMTAGTPVFPTGSTNSLSYDYMVITTGTSVSEPNWDASCGLTSYTGPVPYSCIDVGGTAVYYRIPYSCDRLRGEAPDVNVGALVSGGTCIMPSAEQGGIIIWCTVAGGTAGSTRPNWYDNSMNAIFCPLYGACPTLDGSGSSAIQWYNVGQNDCRTDVVLLDLMSSRPR